MVRCRPLASKALPDEPFCGDIVAFHESSRDVVKELTALSLVETTSFQTDFHRVQFHLADDTFESQHEAIVGFIGIEESIFVRNESAKDGAHFKHVAPVFGVSRETTHFQAEHDTHLLLGDEFQKSDTNSDDRHL